MSKLHIIDHPMIQHKLTRIRDINTGAKDFRDLLKEIAMLMGYEVTRDLPLTEIEIETPMMRTKAYEISGKKLAIVPILRAGLGLVDGLLNLLPVAKVGHIGLYRDHETHNPVFYYCKLPEDIDHRSDAGYGRKRVRRDQDAERERLYEHPPDVPRGCPRRNTACADRSSRRGYLYGFAR